MCQYVDGRALMSLNDSRIILAIIGRLNQHVPEPLILPKTDVLGRLILDLPRERITNLSALNRPVICQINGLDDGKLIFMVEILQHL